MYSKWLVYTAWYLLTGSVKKFHFEAFDMVGNIFVQNIMPIETLFISPMLKSFHKTIICDAYTKKVHCKTRKKLV